MIKKNTIKKENLSANVSALELRKQNLISAKEATGEKPGFNFAGLMQTELKPVIDHIAALNARLIHVQEKQDKIFELIFNDNANANTLAIIEKLDHVIKSVAFNKPIETKTENKVIETKTENNKQVTGIDSIMSQFKKLFSGNFKEDGFKCFFPVADFTSPENLKESFRVFNANSSDGLLCARKSNQNFLAALWQVNADNQGDKRISKQLKEITVTTPVKSLKTFANDLNCEEADLQCFIDVMTLQGFIDGDEDKNLLIDTVEESKGIECEEEDIDSFIQFVSESLKIKIK